MKATISLSGRAVLSPLHLIHPNADAFRNRGATNDQITMPNGVTSSANVRLQSKIGTGDRATDAFSNISFDNEGRLSFYGSPRYSLEFHDYRKFGNKGRSRPLIGGLRSF